LGIGLSARIAQPLHWRFAELALGGWTFCVYIILSSMGGCTEAPMGLRRAGDFQRASA